MARVRIALAGIVMSLVASACAGPDAQEPAAEDSARSAHAPAPTAPGGPRVFGPTAPPGGYAAPQDSGSEPPGERPDGRGRPGDVDAGGEPATQPTPAAVHDGPLVTMPLGPPASARGRLVAGYPAKALPPVPGSLVESSSVSPRGRVQQVGLVAVTDRAPGRVLLFHRGRLAAFGFRETPSGAAPGAQAAVFRRGPDSVVVSAARSAGATRYHLYAVLHAGRR